MTHDLPAFGLGGLSNRRALDVNRIARATVHRRVSSVAGMLIHKNHGLYAASKGRVNQFTKALAHEAAPRGISVNAIAPGYVETKLTGAHLDKPGVRADLEPLVPAGDFGMPDELVGPVLSLSSPLAGFVTGQIHHVGGGGTLV